jgi:hypothetical protein
MLWNWQRSDWPNFSWKKERLVKAEEAFLLAAGSLSGAVKHLGIQDRELLTVEAMSTEALTTSEIEGEILDRESVQSSIRKQLGLATDDRRVPPAEQGIAEMMVDLFRSFADATPRHCCQAMVDWLTKHEFPILYKNHAFHAFCILKSAQGTNFTFPNFHGRFLRSRAIFAKIYEKQRKAISV